MELWIFSGSIKKNIRLANCLYRNLDMPFLIEINVSMMTMFVCAVDYAYFIRKKQLP